MPRNRKTKNQKRQNYFWGLVAEFVTIIFLSLKFYRFLKWREKTHFGEIDLIFQKGKYLVFVEVKARKNIENARASITKTQQTRIMEAAKLFAKRNPWANELQWRFDAVLILPNKLPIHIINAFDRN